MPFLRSIFFVLIASSAFAQSNSQPGTRKFDGQLWWNYVKILGDDNMEGRNTGSEGLKRAEVPGPLGSHYSSVRERWSALKKAGAIGIIFIPNPHSMDIPWERLKVLRTQVGMMLTDETLDDTAGIKL